MASDNTLAYLAARGAELPSGEDTRLEVVTVTGGDRFVVNFDAASNEYCIWTIPEFPDVYQGGTLKLNVRCIMTSATSGDVDLDVQVEAVTPGDSVDLDSAVSFDTANSVDNTTVPATAGHLFEVSVTLTNKDSIAAGDFVRIKLIRDAASDTATGDLRVLGCSLVETVSGYDLSAFDTLVVPSSFGLDELGDVDTTGVSEGDVLTWDGTSLWTPTAPSSGGLPRNYITGYVPSYVDGTSITYSVGSCRSTDNSADLDLNAAITKSLNATFAEGDGSGGGDVDGTGASLYAFAINKTSSPGTIDVYFDDDVHATNIPSGWDSPRLIHAFKLDDSGVIYPFRAMENGGTLCIQLNPPVLDSTDGTGISHADGTLQMPAVPEGLKCHVHFHFTFGGSAAQRIEFHDPDLTITYDDTGGNDWFGGPDNNVRDVQVYTADGTNPALAMEQIWRWTDVNGQLITSISDGAGSWDGIVETREYYISRTNPVLAEVQGQAGLLFAFGQNNPA